MPSICPEGTEDNQNAYSSKVAYAPVLPELMVPHTPARGEVTELHTHTHISYTALIVEELICVMRVYLWCLPVLTL